MSIFENRITLNFFEWQISLQKTENKNEKVTNCTRSIVLLVRFSHC